VLYYRYDGIQIKLFLKVKSSKIAKIIFIIIYIFHVLNFLSNALQNFTKNS